MTMLHTRERRATERPTPGLPETRSEIDRIDAEIVRLLSARLALVTRLAFAKRAAGFPFRDPEREEEIIENAAQRGQQLGLPKKEVRKIFRQVLKISAKSCTWVG